MRSWPISTLTMSSGLIAAPSLASFQKLIETAWLRRKQPVRLLGLGVRLGEGAQLEQLNLFDEHEAMI